MIDFTLVEHITVVTASGGDKTVTFSEGAWELSAKIVTGAGLALTVQHRPSKGDNKPAAVTLPVGVAYSRHHKMGANQAATMSDIQFTVPDGATAVFQVEARHGYEEPVVADAV